MTANKEKNEQSLSPFLCCCPFFNSTSDRDDPKLNSSGSTEYEYVIENLAIRRAPKVYFDSKPPSPKPKKSLRTTQTIKPCARDCSTLAVRTSPQEVVLGPVLETTLSGGDCRVSKEIYEKFEPCYPCGRGIISKQLQFKCIRDKLKDDFILKKILLPPSQVQRIEHPKMQVVADIHKGSEDDNMFKKDLKAIPVEIQKTIDALKMAKPQLASASLRRNKLNLMRSVSDTSCENKETICNFMGVEHLKGETTEDTRSSLNDFCCDGKRKSLSKLLQSSKKIEPPRTAEPNIIPNEQNKNEDKLDQKLNNQSLKWKIVINKHKGIFTSKK